MIIGITGLGLIGGSFAKSIQAKTHNTVLAADIDTQTMSSAKLCGAVDDDLTTENISRCDLLILALSPSNTIEWMKLHAHELKQDTTVIDVCGVKRVICDAILPLADRYGFTFIGGHPMAGFERGGFENSRADLFDGASMILTPNENVPDDLKSFLMDLGFSSVILTSPEEHDRIIAYTSQLSHVISSAYIKSHVAIEKRGFTAGSFRDMTRTAGVDERLWTDLFMNNREFLIEQVETMLANLTKFLDALKNDDAIQIEMLLRESREIKALEENK